MVNMPKKVCVSGYYGFDNFGDEIILKVLTDNLKDFDVTVFSSNPLKTSSLYRVKSVNSFDIKSVLTSLAMCDYLISGGGSLLQDVTSLKSLIYYLFTITAAQFFKKKVIIFAQGIGPVNNKLFSFITFYLLKKVHYISVRDKKSLELLNKYNINAELCNDPAWNIQAVTKKNKNITGIQLRSFPLLTDEIIKSLADCVNLHFSQKKIKIFSLQNKIDFEVCNKFKNYLLSINPNINAEIIENTSNEKLINDMCEADELIAMRYHACLIAIKNKIKLLPVSYDIKVQTLAEEFNLDYIDLNSKQNISNIFNNFLNSEISYNETDKLKYDFKKLIDFIKDTKN